MRRNFFFFAPLAVVGLAAFVAAGGWIVQHLWNWLTPALFGWHALTFWQALGLLVLCRILFGNLGGPGGRPGHLRRRMAGSRGPRWEDLTPEERERFRRGWPCGPAGPAPAAGPGPGGPQPA